MAIRKQLQWDESTDMWPITDASAVHYTYDPSDSGRIISPVSGISYGLDKFLNGLESRFLTQDLVTALATNINKGVGVLYNSAASTTAVAAPSTGTSDAFVKVTYTSAGAFNLSFDTTTYLPTSTKYAISGSVGGSASSAVKLDGGAKGNLVYQSGTGATAFLTGGAAGKILGWDGTNGLPQWINAEVYTTVVSGTSATSYSLLSAQWTNTINLPTLKGTYALFIEDANSGAYAGVFSIYGNVNGKIEEIPLHWNTKESTTNDNMRIYAATLNKKLVLSTSKAEATSHSVIIKYKRII